MPKGTVLFTSRAPIGYVAIADREIATNQGFRSFVCEGGIWPQYVYFYMKTMKPLAEQMASGTTFLEISGTKAGELPIVIPPFNEQKRIAAKLESLLSKAEACRQRLDTIPVILKRFRQSVLIAACSGSLTAEWREQYPDLESARGIIAKAQGARLLAAVKPTHRQHIEEVFAIQEQQDSDDLPESWQYVALAKLCESFQYGTSSKSAKTGNVPVLRMGNIQNGEIDWSDLVFTSDEDEIQKYRLTPNSVLFNRTNSPELVGKTAIYRGERPAIFAGYLIKVNHRPELDPEYLNYCLNTTYAREFCQSVKTDGVSQSNINAQKLARFEVPFCPLAEQQEIVRRVDALFKVADGIEARYNKARIHTDRLTQSILAKAFRGELVPQDPNDEPAEKLLQRIRSTREANGKSLQIASKRRKAAQT